MNDTSPDSLTLSLRSGLSMAALAWGPRDGVPILALHGWLDNAATFSTLAPKLDTHRLIAVDLPGHGRSAHRSPDASQHFVDWVADVQDALDALELDRAVLMGHSMGAGIVALAASAMPDRCERLVMLEGLGPVTTEEAQAPALLRRALRQRNRRSKDARVYPNLDALVKRRCEVNPTLYPESARAILSRSVVEVEGGVRGGEDIRLKASSRLRLTEAHARAFLKSVRCPVYLLRAKQGWPVDSETAQARLDCFQDLQLVEVGGGHHVHLDDPTEFVDSLSAFLNAR